MLTNSKNSEVHPHSFASENEAKLSVGVDSHTSQKRIFIETYGCQMNEYDTQLVKAILTKAQYQFVPQEDEADIILLNTCAIRENAHRKVYGRVHSILHKRGLTGKNQFPPKGGNSVSSPQSAGGQNSNQVLIGILGCMATNLRKELFENRKLKIDFIAGPDSYKRLPKLIEESYAINVETGLPVLERLKDGPGKPVSTKPYDVTLSEFETYSDIYPTREMGINAWLAVMRGCNNFCTFCVVPYTRGRERSRSVENVVEEVQKLAQEGFKQVTLLGQNVNSYCHENADFADLLEAVSKVEGIERIRFTSPHPKDFPEKLLRTIAGNPKVCKHIHLPLQAGNNRILELMDRTYTQEEFLELVEKIRRLIPNVALTTDIIAGFPTETEEEFQDTIKVMQQVEFDSAFIFKYSQRKDTIASRKYPDDILEEIKTDRVVRLNELQKAISLKKNQGHIGQTFEVLIEEERTPKSADQFQGRTDGNHVVIFPKGPYQRGQTIKVHITDATSHVLLSKNSLP